MPKNMRYVSVCSGIEAVSVAWHHLVWEAVAFSEIEAFPSALLEHHYPDVPNLGDMTEIRGRSWRGKADILVGGTPCQAFSVAGKRQGLDDERGNLTLKFVELADDIQPKYTLWENVPGVLTIKDNAFGCFLGALCGETVPLEPAGPKWSDAGYVLGPKRAIAWRVLDAQYFGLAQRRRRVFVVACPRDGADPRQVLFECEGVRRDTPPSRETEQKTAAGAASGVGACGADSRAGHLTPIHSDATRERSAALTPSPDAEGRVRLRDPGLGVGTDGDPQYTLAATGVHAVAYAPEVSPALKARDYEGPSSDGAASGSHWDSPNNPHPTLNQSLRSSGGIGVSNQEVFSQRGAGIVPYAPEVSPALKARDYKGPSSDGDGDGASLVATASPAEMSGTQYAGTEELSPALSVTHKTAVAFETRFARNGRGAPSDVVPPLKAQSGGTGTGDAAPCVASGSTVRRLTPVECERLQGFPDGYTQISWRGKEPEDCPDGLRYKALGNSMAVDVMAWLGESIDLVEDLERTRT